VQVRADIVDLGAFSVHADRGELMGWLDTAEEPPEVVYLVHGEPDSARALQTSIIERRGWDVIVARDAERVRLD
jgi:metallo-beta-lactamase family protein